MKKTLSMILILIFINVLSISSALANQSAISVDVQANRSTNKLVITGTISTGEGKDIVIKIYEPSGKLLSFDQILSGTGGAYQYDTSLNGYGQYKILVHGGPGIDKLVTYNYESSSGGSSNDESGDSSGQNTETTTETKTAEKIIQDISKELEKLAGKVDSARNLEVENMIRKAIKEAGTVVLDNTQVKVQGQKAEIEVKENVLKGAIENVVAVWKELEQKTKEIGIEVKVEKIVNIEIENIEGLKEIAAKLPANLLTLAKSNGIDRIAVNTGLATVAIIPDAFKDDSNKAVQYVELSVANVDKTTLPENVLDKISNKPVYDFNAFVDGNKVSSFNGKKAVRITIDYSLIKGEVPDKIVVYHIDDNEQFKAIKNCKYNVTTGKVTFTTNHFSKYAAMQSNVTFEDIASVTWAKDYIEALAGREIISGTGNNKFEPEAKVTREQFIKMLVEAFGFIDDTATATFDDVTPNAWYYKYVASAYKAGIVDGIGGNKFGVGSSITRQDMATMAYRALKAAGAKINTINRELTFADKSQISSYATEAIAVMQKENIISGVGDNRFAPQENSTRAQAAKILFGLYKLID